MAEIRLSKLSKQFGIGLGTLVEFLESKNIEVENNPNAKVSDEIIPDLEAKFGADLKAKLEADQVTTKLKEMIEGPSAKKVKEEEEEFVKPDIIIKSNLTSTQTIVKEEEKKEPEPVIKEIKETEIHAEKLSGPKVVNKIDLSAIGKKARAEEKVTPEPVSAQEPEKEAAPVVKTESVIEAKAPETPVVRNEEVAEPKVIVDKSTIINACKRVAVFANTGTSLP